MARNVDQARPELRRGRRRFQIVAELPGSHLYGRERRHRHGRVLAPPPPLRDAPPDALVLFSQSDRLILALGPGGYCVLYHIP